MCSFAIISAFIVVLVSYFIVFLRRKFTFWRSKGVLQVSAWEVLRAQDFGLLSKRHVTEAVQEAYDLSEEAKYVGWYEFASPAVLLKDPELIKLIAIKDFDHFTDHKTFDMDEELLFSKSLVSLKGEKWKSMRHLLSPAFTSSKMKSMYTLMSECGKNFAEHICQEAKDGDGVFDMRDAFRRCATDVIATCAYGLSVNSMKDKNNEFYLHGVESSNIGPSMILRALVVMIFPQLAKLLKIKVFSRKIESFFLDVVRTTIAARKDRGITRPDMMQLLMDSNEKEQEELSIEDMASQAFIFFLGGFGTTTVLMCFLAHLLAVNPDIQKKLQEEVDQVMKETHGEPTYEAINRMKYLDAVVNETLRLYPPMAQTDRVCTKRYELPPALPGSKPIQMDPGSRIIISMFSLHRDPSYFEDPEVFDPNRFLGDNKTNVSPAYMPFGLGPRMCIGNRFVLLEAKTVIFQLLAKCDLKPCEKTQDPMVLDESQFDLTPKNGFWVKIVPRSS